MNLSAAVKLISHASILIDIKGIKILTDPWFFGTSFNDGWELSPRPDLTYIENLIYDVDIIWISHEHPDHLHFPTLRWVVSVIKKDVRVYFQKTNSEKIFDALKKLGFKYFESMIHKKKIRVSSGIYIACYAHRHLDSALAVFVDSKFWLLNINDTELNKADTSIILREWGSPSIIYNQFSIAGSDGVKTLLKADASGVLEKMAVHHRQLNANLTVPFASYVRFARSDNNYMNEYSNSPFDAEKKFKAEGLKLCIQSYSSESLKWTDVDSLPVNLDEVHSQNPEDFTSSEDTLENDSFVYNIVPHDKVKTVIENRLQEWRKNTNSLLWHFFNLRSMTFCVTDWENEIWVCDFNTQTFYSTQENLSPDIYIASQPLSYAFQMPFGIQTLGVSGRYQFSKTTLKVPKTWKIIRAISSLHNAGIHLSLSGLFTVPTLRWVWQRREGLVSQVAQQISRYLNK